MSHRDLLERARQHSKQAAQASLPQGDSVNDVTDPQEKGTVTPPTHPSQAKIEASMPAGTRGSANGKANQTLETTELNAAGTGAGDVPSVVDGNCKDESFNTPTAKLAAQVSNTAARLRAIAKSASEKTEPTDATKVEVSEKKEDKEKLPKDLPAGAQIPPFASEKAAAEDLANGLPVDAYVKLASVLLETEEGINFATRLIKQAKGAEAANALINNALVAQDQFQKAAAAHQAGGNLVEQIFASANPAERQIMLKVAAAHQEQIAVIEASAHPETVELEKQAYAEGAMDAGAMQEAGEAVGAEGEGELPGGGEETSDQDIMAVIQQLVESGQLPPEVAEQLLLELQGAEGAEGAAPEGVEGIAPEGVEGIAPETAEEKSAAAKDPISALTGAHRKSASAVARGAADLIRAALSA